MGHLLPLTSKSPLFQIVHAVHVRKFFFGTEGMNGICLSLVYTGDSPVWTRLKHGPLMYIPVSGIHGLRLQVTPRLFFSRLLL